MFSVKPLALLVFLLNSVCTANELSKPLKICVDNGNWRPFVYQEQGQIKGLHINTVKTALHNLNISYEFIPSPWKRCLKAAEKGAYDAIATASFNSQRAQYLYYPQDAHLSISDWRVGQVQYNIIVHKSSTYQYQSDWMDIPQPIRVSRDYSIGIDLKAMGLPIDDSSINDLQNLKRLVREKNGSVVALPSLVEWADQEKEFKGKIRLIEKPLKSKSYYLAFSKNGEFNFEQANKVWQQIRNVRENNQFSE